MDAFDDSAPFQIWHHGLANRDDSSGARDAAKRQQQAVRRIWLNGGATPSGARLPPAFAEAAPGEARECRRARLEAYESCWSAMKSSIQEAVDAADAAALKRLAAFVTAEHASAQCRESLDSATATPAATLPTPAAVAAAGDALFALNPGLPRRPPRSCPAAVLDAGGAPPQDSQRAVDSLAALLTAGDQGAYLARLSGVELGAGAAVADILQKVLRGWSGLDVVDVDAQLLVRWHRDSTGSSPAAAAAAAAAPAHNDGGATQQQTADGATQAPPAENGISADVEAVAGQQEAGQQEANDAAAAHSRLRPRKQPEPRAGAAAAAAAAAAQQAAERRTNAARPLVLLLEGAEAAEPATLDALIAVLSEVHEQLPVTLVLTIRGALPLLLARLSRPAVRALCCTCFRLPLPEARLEDAVLGGILGGASSGVFPGPALLAWLSRRFTVQEASIEGLLRSLQVACMAHFQHAPLSAAAAALVSSGDGETSSGGGGIAAAVRAAVSGNSAVLRDARQRQLLGVQPSDRPTAVAAAVGDAVAAASIGWAGWAVAVRCMALAVEVAKLQSEEHRVLPLAAAAATGATAFVDGSTFARVVQAVWRMQEAEAVRLAWAWADQPEAVSRGEGAFGKQAAALQAILEAAEQSDEVAAAENPETAGPDLEAADPTTPAVVTPAAAATPPPADATVDAALDTGSRKRKPGSRASRRSLLVQTTKGQHAAAVARGTATALDAPAARTGSETLPKRLARWLRDTAAAHLAAPPFALPGAAALCLNDVAALDAAVAAAPRAAVHAALTAPQALQGGFGGVSAAAASAASGGGAGILRGYPDAAVAYQLTQGYGEVVGLGRAFVDFADVATAGGAAAGEEAEEAADEEDAAGPSNGRLSYAHRRKKRAGKRVTQEQPQPAAAGSAARSTRRRKQTREAAEAEMRAQVAALPADQQLQLASRYQEAALALQQAGLVVVRHGSRGTQLQRAAWQPTCGINADDPALLDAWDEEALLEDAEANGGAAEVLPEAALPSARASALGNGAVANGAANGSTAASSDSAGSDAEGDNSSDDEGGDAAAAAPNGPCRGVSTGKEKGNGRKDRKRDSGGGSGKRSSRKSSKGSGGRHVEAGARERRAKVAAAATETSGKRGRGRKREADAEAPRKHKRRR